MSMTMGKTQALVVAILTILVIIGTAQPAVALKVDPRMDVPSTVAVNEEVQLDARPTVIEHESLDGCFAVDIRADYYWEVTDPGGRTESLEGINPSYEFDQPGEWTVELTVVGMPNFYCQNTKSLQQVVTVTENGADETGESETEADVETESSPEVSAELVEFQPPSGTFEPGEVATATVRVRNTGDEEHTFYIGFSAQDADGEFHSGGSGAPPVVTVEPGVTESMEVGWQIPEDAPTGEYGVVAAVWMESDPSELETRLDSISQGTAFQVVTPTPIPTSTRTPTPSPTTEVPTEAVTVATDGQDGLGFLSLIVIIAGGLLLARRR